LEAVPAPVGGRLASAGGLSRQRCFNHARREAAGRCTECRRYFCRECITEHEGRLSCAACLRRSAGKSRAAGKAIGVVMEIALAAGALLTAWLVFYAIGEWLIGLPSEFHSQ
jgi:hypothetical protein